MLTLKNLKNHIKMKNRSYSALLITTILMIQLFAMINPVLAINSYNSSPSKLNEPSFEPTGIQGHSTSFHFPLNRTSPLMTEDDNEKQNGDESSPKAAYYNDEERYVMTIYLEKSVVEPGESEQVHIQLSQNFTLLAGQSINIKVYKGFYRYFFYRYNSPSGFSIVFNQNFVTDENGEISFSIPTGSFESGLYSIVASSNNFYEYKEFVVGNKGIFVRGPRYFANLQDYRGSVQIVNVSNFSPLPNENFTVEFSGYDYSVDNWISITQITGTTSIDGWAQFETIMTSEFSNYYTIKMKITTEDGNTYFETWLYRSWRYYYFSMWGEEQESSQDRYQFVVTTDKTIYSPGETLHLRVLVMQYSFMNESRMALEEQLVNITYYDPEMNAYFWTTLVTNQYGVLTFDVPFDNDAILGKYSFKFTIGEISYNYGIKLQYYEKPVFRVTIDTNGRDFYPSSDNILEKIFKPANFEGYVIAEYYFGQPVAGANVELILKNYQGYLVSNISGKTDGRGRFYFNINLETLGDLRYSFFAEAIVIDDYQRKASTECSFTRYNELGAWGYLSKWDPKPGEQLEYFYSVYQYIYNPNSWWWDLNPLSNVSVDINIYGYILSPWYNDIIDTGIKLHNYKGKTNEYGSGKLNFSIPIEDVKTYNWFRIQLSVELEDGRSHTSSYYFRYQKYNLDLSIQNDQLQPGDTFQLTASFTDSLSGENREGHGRIRIYDAQYQTIRTGSFDFNGQLNFSVPLSEFSPEGTYYISSYVYTPSNSYYRGYEYHSAHVGFHVGNYYSFEWDCNLTKTSQYSSIYNVEMGKIIHFFGTTNVSSNMNGSFEIYKRGLVSSTSLDLSSGTISLNLTVSAKLGPSFMVMISLLSSSGRLFQQNLMFHVQYPTEVQLSTDKEVYEPGDTLTLTITPKSELPTLLSLSFIDSSVLAVEPEDDSEMVYFTQNSYYPWIFSASSWGSDWNIYRYWWYCYDGPRYLYFGYDYGVNNWRGSKDMYLTYDLQENSVGGVNDAMSYGDIVRNFQTEIRKNISESANWIPQQIITEPTNITFKLPDNIGEWTIRAVTNGMDINSKQILWGNIQTIQIKSYLPFFVEFDIPNPLNQDDIMDLKGYIYNYLGQDIEATVAIDAPGLNVLNNPVQTVNIPNNFVSEIEFSIYLSEPFEHNISVVAATNVSGIGYSDAKQMTAYIHPHGIEISKRTVGYLNSSDGSTTLNFTIEPSAVYHKESLSLYTNLMDISLDSWDQLIGYPYGCVEQTISKLRSTALVYNYLNQTEQLTSDLQKSLDAMIQTGLARIYNFQFLNGGWGWWHGDEEDSQIQMSTIVLSALLQIQNLGFTVKLDVISDGIDYILSKQTTSGSWQFPYYSASEIESTTFVLNTLLQSPNATLLYLTELNKGFNHVDSLWQKNTLKNSYTAALWYLTIHNTIFSDATLEAELITFLKSNMHTTQGMAYWDRPDDDNWYWRNLGNRVAITAYALIALAEDDFIDNLMLIQNGVQFMLSQRNRYGWWCTADTSAAILSLTKLAQYSMYAGFINFNGTANIDVSPIFDGNNSNDPENFDISLDLSDNTYHPAQLKADLSNFSDIGNNSLNISVNGTGQLVYIFTSIQVLRGSPNFTSPTNISVQSGDIFEIPISLTNLEDPLLFQNVSIEIKNLPPEFQLINESYSRYIENWTPDDLIVFQFNASQSGGIYSIGPISISGTLFYNQDENDSSIISNDGELGIAVDLASIPITVENTLPYAAGEYLYASSFYNINTCSGEKPISADSQSQFLSKVSFDKLALTKESNSPEFLFPGKIIPITLTVENTGLLKEYYTLTDSIPTGMEVLVDSISIFGETGDSEITYSIKTNKINFFLPSIGADKIQIEYRLQVNFIKNSKMEGTILWGMYDPIELKTTSQYLGIIPRLITADQLQYRDTLKPVINSLVLKQSNDANDISIQLTLDASDNSAIQKIKIVYNQGNGWISQNFYKDNSKETIELTMDGLENQDSQMSYYVEVWDIYGNIATSDMDIISLVSRVIPYLLIGGLIGVSIGLASVTMQIIKKKVKNTDYAHITNKSFLDSTK